MQLIERLSAKSQQLQANPNEVKVVSFGAKSGTKSFIDEVSKSVEFGLTIRNETSQNVFIAIVSGLGTFSNHAQSFNPGGFMAADDLLRRVGADCVLADGTIFEKEKAPASGTYDAVTVTTKNAKRKINELTKYAAKNPFRFTKFVLTSSKNDGTPESSNFNNRIKSIWLSPIVDTVEQEFSLRSIVRDKFQAQMLEVDFQKDAPNLQAIVSDEHAMVIQVNAGTTLSIGAYIGAQLSNAQYLYRLANTADSIMRPARLGM